MDSIGQVACGPDSESQFHAGDLDSPSGARAIGQLAAGVAPMTLRRARSRIKDWHLCALCFVAFPVILVALMLAGLSEFGQGLLAFGFMFLVAGLINKQESDHRSSDSATLDDDASDLER